MMYQVQGSFRTLLILVCILHFAKEMYALNHQGLTTIKFVMKDVCIEDDM